MTRPEPDPSPAGRQADTGARGVDGASIELSPEVSATIDATATAFVDRLCSAEPGSSAFRRAIRTIDDLGDREVRTTTRIVAAFQDRPRAAVRALMAERAPLRRNLEQLARAAEDVERVAGEEESSADELAAAVGSAEERVRRVLPALDADRLTLEQDNAALAQQERALWTEIQTLRRYASLGQRIDDLVDERATHLDAADPARARLLRDEALYAVRRRRRDLLLQLAVASQAYAALRLIEQDNLEVIWAIRAAMTTTVTALRAALIVAGAVAGRQWPGSPAVDGLAAAWSEVLVAVRAVDDRRRRTLAEAGVRETSG